LLLFFQGSKSFRQTNIDLNTSSELFSSAELSGNGVPHGFFYGMGSASGKNYPVLFDVNANASRARQLLDNLVDGGYLDSATKTVKVEIVLLNIEDESLVVLTISASSQPKGGIYFKHQLTFVDPSPYADSGDWVRFALELVFLGLLTGLLWKEVLEIRHEMRESDMALVFRQ
jgi:hypothetical protein